MKTGLSVEGRVSCSVVSVLVNLNIAVTSNTLLFLDFTILNCYKTRKRYYTARKNNALHKNEITKRIMINACKHYKANNLYNTTKNISLVLRTNYANSEQKIPKIIGK